MQSNNALLLIDVREPFEHAAYNIGGMLIPLAEVMKNAAVIPKDEPVVLYCHRGVRSRIAIQRLEDKFGFKNLINLHGGLGEKENENSPV